MVAKIDWSLAPEEKESEIVKCNTEKESPAGCSERRSSQLWIMFTRKSRCSDGLVFKWGEWGRQDPPTLNILVAHKIRYSLPGTSLNVRRPFPIYTWFCHQTLPQKQIHPKSGKEESVRVREENYTWEFNLIIALCHWDTGMYEILSQTYIYQMQKKKKKHHNSGP